MKVKDANKVVDLINGEFKEIIEKGIYKYFGVNTNITAKIYGKYKDSIVITDSMNDVNKKMTCNKLLRKFIKDAFLIAYAWMEEETNQIYINVHLSYNHTLGGSNGKEIGKLLLYTNTKRTKYLPY